jgi:proteic killer suppression protein
MAKINVVRLSSTAQKQIRRIPQHIVDKLLAWILLIETKGIHDVRKIPGYHDEPLQGLRQGQRSIRLSRSYRAIYTQLETNEVWCVQVEEIHKHAY